MKIEVRYRAKYRYEAEVSFSPHTFRLFPKTDFFVGQESIVFTTNQDADIQYRRDVFDNPIANCFYPERGRDLDAALTLRLELRERNPFHFLLAPHALEIPFPYTDEERRALMPYLEKSEVLALPFWQLERRPTVSGLMELNEAIHKNLRYERREEGAAWKPAETLGAGHGSCRDFAVLLAETLRGIGIAARLVSGYLCEFGEEEKRAEGAMHAWVEAFIPGAGWMGFDPTNGILADHNHITAAVGLTPGDVTPVDGSYYNKTRVGSTMESALEIVQL